VIKRRGLEPAERERRSWVPWRIVSFAINLPIKVIDWCSGKARRSWWRVPYRRAGVFQRHWKKKQNTPPAQQSSSLYPELSLNPLIEKSVLIKVNSKIP
jgi:hypothetical protein